MTCYQDKTDPLVWYFLFKCKDKETPFYGGEYIGKFVLTHKYPAEYPEIYMLTPTGTFNCLEKLCIYPLYLCDPNNEHYYPPILYMILFGFYSILMESVLNKRTYSPIIKKYAEESIEYNKKYYSDIYKEFDMSVFTIAKSIYY